jgi:hypothetical protein
MEAVRSSETMADFHNTIRRYIPECSSLAIVFAPFGLIISKTVTREQLHNLYSSPSIIRTIKSRRMRWAGRVTRLGEKRNPYRILVGKPEGKRPLEDLDVGGRTL